MTKPGQTRDHGGGIDAAAARHGGTRAEWLDLSTGINSVPYQVGPLAGDSWTALPDARAMERLVMAARRVWSAPDDADVIAAPGASALIARLPALHPPARVAIPGPTYNEHAAAFRADGWTVTDGKADALVVVHPNNPDGRFAQAAALDGHDLVVIDESFCDTCPDRSLVALATRPGVIVLKSFGKFWGLAGLRLGFAIALPETCARLSDLLGPWAVSGPALQIGAEALEDAAWADETRRRLQGDAARLDQLMARRGARLVGGTTLFRTYAMDEAAAWQDRLAAAWIWTRRFPYSESWLRLGLPGSEADWQRLEKALG